MGWIVGTAYTRCASKDEYLRSGLQSGDPKVKHTILGSMFVEDLWFAVVEVETEGRPTKSLPYVAATEAHPDGAFGYKDLPPFEHTDFPASLMKLLSPARSDEDAAWRESVKAYHKAAAEMKKARRNVVEKLLGKVIEFETPIMHDGQAINGGLFGQYRVGRAKRNRVGILLGNTLLIVRPGTLAKARVVESATV